MVEHVSMKSLSCTRMQSMTKPVSRFGLGLMEGRHLIFFKMIVGVK